jgi:mono/diheme cytochrome c family protein
MMRLRLGFTATALLCFFATAAFGQELTIKKNGKPLTKVPLVDLTKNAVEVTVNDPVENDQIKYMAVPAASFLKKVYGKDWDTAEEVLFTCVDGFQPSIPKSVFDSAPSYFAFQRSGHTQFVVKKTAENNKIVGLAPLYLIWDTSKTPVDGAFWPYQVTTVDIIKFADKFPKLAPRAQNSESVKRGFLAFRSQCLSCHTINGQGGKAGPELNYPVNVTEYYNERWLKKWIDKPSNIRFNTTMPAFSPDLKDRSRVIDDLVNYLKAMAKNKIKPD